MNMLISKLTQGFYNINNTINFDIDCKYRDANDCCILCSRYICDDCTQYCNRCKKQQYCETCITRCDYCAK